MSLAYDIERCMGETPPCTQRETCACHRDIPVGVDLWWNRNLNDEGMENYLHYIEYQP